MRRSGIGMAAGILLAGLFLWGCGESGTKNSAGTETEAVSASAEAYVIEVLKDGSIVETITEDFSNEYYDEENLKNMILSEVADFNNGSQEGEVSVDKFENKNGKLTVKMKYPSADIYTAYNTDQYNTGSLFLGTVAEAYDAGHSLDVSLKDIKGDQTIGKDELLDMGSGNILIAEEPMYVKVPGKIMYLGENVVADGKNQAEMKADEDGNTLGKYYVVFK